MALAAIILAGFPGSVLGTVRDRLVRQYPGYVVRGAAATLRQTRLCLYDPPEIDKVLDQAADAVFGSSKRPVGFCRNFQRGCRQQAASGKCDHVGHQACSLVKPKRVYLLFQEGDADDRLLQKLAHSTLPHRIPRTIYGQPVRTAEACLDAIEALKRRAERIEPCMKHGSPFLLPPKAFGMGSAVRHMLDRVATGSDPFTELRDFRQDHYDRTQRCFVGRARLGFKPGHSAGLHGDAHDATDIAIALTRRYRLGCSYDGQFHWDVSPMDGTYLNGKYPFDTRDQGRQSPKGRYVNVLVDDCLR